MSNGVFVAQGEENATSKCSALNCVIIEFGLGAYLIV